jgi:hypothetical protein
MADENILLLHIQVIKEMSWEDSEMVLQSCPCSFLSIHYPTVIYITSNPSIISPRLTRD